MEESDKLVICEIFSDVQSGGTQKANIKRLSTILNNKDRTIRESSLNYVLRGCLDSVFIFPKGNSHIDRLLKFLCSLFSALKQESQVVFLQHVATRTGSVNKTVRQRACTFISSILVTLEEELPGDILEEVATALVQRLQDKIPAVRVAAVKAAARLQDPDNMEDQIIQELLRIMNSDSSVTVRTAAVDSILLTSATVTHIIERIRDISIDVRISAINRLEKETDPRKLNVQMRSSIIRYGLTDREEKVNAATRKLIVNWLRLINNNVTMMLRSIDPNENEEVAFLLGMNIMEEILHSSDCPVELRQAARDPYNSWDTCTIASLPPCEILWINIRCMYATKMCAAVVSADIIGSITPDAIVICRLLAGVLECENLKDDSKVIYNVKQLLKLVAFVDQADVCGINKLSTLLSTMVSNLQVPESLVEQIMVAVTNISCGTRSHVEYLETFLTLAEDIRKQADNPEENDEIQIDLIERSLQVIFFTLQTYSNGMRDTGDSIECLKKVLPLILSSLQQPVFSVRGLAIGSLGIICAVSEKLCDQYASVLQQVSQVEFEDPENRVRAIQALTDIACVWPEKFRNSKDVCNLISRCFESPEEIIKCYALESAMKLLFAGICDEPKFLATLVKNFFISDTEEDINTSYLQECGYPGGRSRLQQLMSVFFQTFFSSTNYASITTVLESIPQLVADTTADIKCEMSDVSLMKKVVNHVLILSESLPAFGQKNVSEDKSQEELKSQSEMQQQLSTTACILRSFFAALCREVLKLNTSKGEKLVAKEYCKLLSTLHIHTWLQAEDVQLVTSALNTIAKSKSVERASEKLITTLLKQCDKVQWVEGKESDFFSIASGLADLVMVEHNYLQSRTIDDSSSDEVEASDEEDEDAEEDSEQADVPEIQQLSISSTNNAETRMPKRSARSAKTAATLKIGKQLDDETNMNSKKNKRIYGEEDTNFDENAVPN